MRTTALAAAAGVRDRGGGSLMDVFLRLVEQRIEQAERDGAFEDLPGRGLPLVLEDLDGVPAELRASYILLKTHGFVPPEIEARKEWLRLEDLIAATADTHDAERLRTEARRAALRYRLLMEQRGGDPACLAEYHDQVVQRLQR